MNDTPNDTPFLETRRAYLAVFISYLLIAVAAYWSILNNTLIGDDYFYTVKIGELSVSGLWHLFDIHPSFIRPLPSLVFWLQYKLFGVDGTASHLINVAFHAGNGFLLFWLLRKLRVSAYAALLGGFLFLIMPVAAEPVTWSSGRFDLMSTFFILLAAGLYLGAVRQKNASAYAGSLACALAAMLCKESAMILVVLFPLLELLYNVYGDGSWPQKQVLRDRLTAAGIRLIFFYMLFAGYIAMRFAILGRLGGYKNVPAVSRPVLVTAAKTGWTFLSPVSSLMVSKGFLIVIAAMFIGLLLASQGMVLFRWKSSTAAVRKSWFFLVIFLFVTIVPVNTQLFSFGIGHNLKDSRELYIITMMALSIMVVGLLDFGWKSRQWRIAVTIAALLLALPWVWGLQKNNYPWERSAALSNTILEDTMVMLPEPPAGAKIYYRGVPEWENGAYVFVNALRHAVAERYGRKDLQVIQVWQDDREFDLNSTNDGYLFIYDPAQEKIRLVHGPGDG